MGTEATITRGTIVPGGEMANHLAIQMPAIASSCRATVPPCRSSSHAEWARHGGTLRRCQPPQEMSTSTGDVNLLKRCQPPQEMSTSSGDVNLLRRCQPPQEMSTSSGDVNLLRRCQPPHLLRRCYQPSHLLRRCQPPHLLRRCQPPQVMSIGGRRLNKLNNASRKQAKLYSSSPCCCRTESFRMHTSASERLVSLR